MTFPVLFPIPNSRAIWDQRAWPRPKLHRWLPALGSSVGLYELVGAHGVPVGGSNKVAPGVLIGSSNKVALGAVLLGAPRKWSQ